MPKKCFKCEKEISPTYNFCPYCGSELRSSTFFNIFDDIEREFERIDKVFSSDFLKLPKIRFGPSSGIAITIHSTSEKEPKIEVKTFGKYKEIEPEIKRKLGIKPAIEEVKEKKRPIPKIAEEPETKVKDLGTKEIITVKLPNVKEENIEIRKLEQSIEIKAFSDDKVYFTLLPIPQNAKIINKSFENEILRIEVMK